ncbi:MAG TPA: ComEA family DNA-binding protein [Thermomicrobiales bacterium]|nr:ComEA family DNA-binding protein [Thermomicrobiales bacterium]
MSLTRIGLIVVAVIAAVAGAYALYRAMDERSAPPIVIEDAAATMPVVVDVRGAVESAGVYELPPGARVQDAVAAAGGLTEVADLATVNLARRLRDGEVVVIVELPAPGSTPQPTVSTGETSSESSSSRININTATAEELEVLPGVGQVTAARIIAFREQNGPFRSVDDLIHVQGISDRTIDGFRDMVTVGP